MPTKTAPKKTGKAKSTAKRKKPPTKAQSTRELNIAQRRAKVADLYLRKLTQWEIAERLNVDQSTVSLDIKAIKEGWREQFAESYDDRIQMNLKELALVRKRAWEQFEESCEPAETHTKKQETRTGGGDDGDGTVESVTSSLKGQSGNPAFLNTIADTLNMEFKLLGAFDNVKEGTTVVQINWGDMYTAESNRRETVNPVDERLRELDNQAKMIHTKEVAKDGTGTGHESKG